MMRHLFLCAKSVNTDVVIPSATAHKNESVPMRLCIHPDEVPVKNAVMKSPSHDETPSMKTDSTGFDNSHTSRRNAQCEQPNQPPMARSNSVKNEWTKGNQKSVYNPDDYIKPKFETSKGRKGTVTPRTKRDNGSRFYNYDNKVDSIVKHRGKDDYSLGNCDCTKAYIMTSNGNDDSLPANKPYTTSLDSTGDDDVQYDGSKRDSTITKRISGLTEAIAMKQSDIAINFCSMIQRMKCIVEDMERMQYTNSYTEWKGKSSNYLKECQLLHETAIKMANKQVLLAHQGTKYVEHLEQKVEDLQSDHQLLLSSYEMALIQQTLLQKQQPHLDSPEKKHLDVKCSTLLDKNNHDDNSATTEEGTPFRIQEISFCHMTEVDLAELGTVENSEKTTDGSNTTGSIISGLESTVNVVRLQFLV